jgi:hypothetical protein
MNIFIISVVIIIIILLIIAYYKNKKSKESLVGVLTFNSSLIDTLNLNKNLYSADRRKFIKNLTNRYNSSNVNEVEYGNPNRDTAYVVGKGRKFGICLKNSQQPIDSEIIKFVSMHELAHIGSNDTGHTIDFVEMFKFLITEARRYNLYNGPNFDAFPKYYCGLMITDDPTID